MHKSSLKSLKRFIGNKEATTFSSAKYCIMSADSSKISELIMWNCFSHLASSSFRQCLRKYAEFEKRSLALITT